MPNWCYTRLDITGPSNEIGKLNQAIDEIEKSSDENYSWTGLWLGKILTHLNEWIDEDTPSCSCRGSIIYRTFDGDTLALEVESAWGPQLGAIKKLTDKYAPNAVIIYRAEEPGCQVYLTNDDYWVGKYCIDVWDEENTPKSLVYTGGEPVTRKELRKSLLEALNTKGHFLTNDLISKAQDDLGDFLTINEYEFCDLEDVCE